jgi:predicted nucleic acid-binding protein
MGTTAADPVFVDTNILIYTTMLDSPFHARASQALDEFEKESVQLWISRQVLREYLAALTRGDPLTLPVPLADLISDVRVFESHFRVAEDGHGVTEHLLAIVGTIPVGGKQVHDANIVATMLAHGIPRLFTHNVGDFHRFSTLIEILPLVEANKNGK